MLPNDQILDRESTTLAVRSLGDSPPASSLWLSVVLHLVGLALVVAILHTAPARIAPPIYQSAQMIRGTPHVSLPAKATPSHARPLLVKPHPLKVQPQKEAPAAEGANGQGLMEQAERETVAMTYSFKFHAIYGFYPGHKYHLAVQTSGEMPSISAAQLPPNFQQYVIVEVTIDVEGRVADARIVSGLVDLAIQQTLLSAIHEFKYSPATRDGLPIPSQLDLVIHIPS